MPGRVPDLARFGDLVREEPVPLADAAIAAAGYLGFGAGPEPERQRLTDLAAGVAEPTLDAVVQHLMGDVGLHGNREQYYEAANSLLPVVLDRRLGIPISLAIITVDVAGQLGAPASVVAMPGHVLVGDGPAPTCWYDVFDGGRRLGPDGARRRFAAIHGDAAPFDDRYLAATDGPLVAARLLGNLVGIYARSGEAQRLLRVLELRSMIPAVATADRPALAAALTRVGRFEDAAQIWSLVARAEPDGSAGAEQAGAAAEAARHRLN